MARDNEDIFLKNKLDGFCQKLNAGLICNTSVDEVKRVSIVRGINTFIEGLGDDLTLCEDVKMVEAPSIICLQGTQSIDQEYPFVVTDPIVMQNILFGWYDLNPSTQPNPITPNVVDIANDITANPGNYSSKVWVASGVSDVINNSQIAYHVIRIPNTIGNVQIIDAAGVLVNAAFTQFTDSNYNYYVLLKPVSKNPSVSYTVKL